MSETTGDNEMDVVDELHREQAALLGSAQIVIEQFLSHSPIMSRRYKRESGEDWLRRLSAFKEKRTAFIEQAEVLHRDPVCLAHGKRQSEHDCLICCLCFESLTPEECHVLPDGSREDVCKSCAEKEAKRGVA